MGKAWLLKNVGKVGGKVGKHVFYIVLYDPYVNHLIDPHVPIFLKILGGGTHGIPSQGVACSFSLAFWTRAGG